MGRVFGYERFAIVAETFFRKWLSGILFRHPKVLFVKVLGCCSDGASAIAELLAWSHLREASALLQQFLPGRRYRCLIGGAGITAVKADVVELMDGVSQGFFPGVMNLYQVGIVAVEVSLIEFERRAASATS